jgi:hypothetical protein
MDERLLNLTCHLFEDSQEEILLVPEVVVQRPSGEPGVADDLLGQGGLEARSGEEGPGRVEERSAGVLHVCR